MTKRKTPPTGKRPQAPPAAKPSIAPPIVLPPWLWWVGLAIILLVYAYFRYQFILTPLERDEGSYGYIGQLILDGKRPYLDFYEMKPPALFYSYALLVGVFGASLEGLHLAVLTLYLLNALMLFLIARNLFGRPSALLAPLSYLSLALASLASGYTAQAEHITTFYLIAGYYFASRGYASGGKKWEWVLAGAFLATAFMTKQIAALMALPVLLILAGWVYNQPTPRRSAWLAAARNTGWMALGGVVVVAGWLAVVAAQGGWNDMLFWVLEYPKKYASKFTWEDRKPTFIAIFNAMWREYLVLWLLALAGLALGLISRRYRIMALFSAAVLGTALISVFPGYYFYSHYWLFLAPAAALCAALFAGALTERLSSAWPSAPAGIVAVLMLFVVFLWDFGKRKTYYTSPNIKQIMRVAYADNPFPETLEIAKELKKRSAPGDELLVMGSEPQLNFYTGMRSPTRHFFMGFLAKYHPEETAWIAEAKADAERSKPRFLVHVVHPFSWAYPNSSKTEMFDFGFAFASKYYKTIGMVELSPEGSQYYWDEAALQHPRSKDKFIQIFERR